MSDGGRQGQHALGDARDDSAGGEPNVALEAELVLEGIEYGFDPLSQRTQEAGVVTWGLVAGGPGAAGRHQSC